MAKGIDRVKNIQELNDLEARITNENDSIKYLNDELKAFYLIRDLIDLFGRKNINVKENNLITKADIMVQKSKKIFQDKKNDLRNIANKRSSVAQIDAMNNLSNSYILYSGQQAYGIRTKKRKKTKGKKPKEKILKGKTFFKIIIAYF